MTLDPETAWHRRYQSPQHAAQSVSAHPLHLQVGVVQAYAQWRAGDYEHALRRVVDLEPGLRDEGNALWLTRMLHIKGVLLDIPGDPPAALACYQEQLRLARQLGDVEMEGLAHNAIGASRFSWDTPQRALRSFSRAREVFERGGAGHEANLGLALLNLAMTHGTLGDTALEAKLLDQAEALLVGAQAWSLWNNVFSMRALRRAEAGFLEEARALFSEAAALELPNDSQLRLKFFRAKVEAYHGDAAAARGELAAMEPWARIRQDFLELYLETRAEAEARSGDPAAAYATMRELLRTVRSVQAHDRNVRLRTQESEPERARAAALEALSRQDTLTGLGNRHAVQERAADLLQRGRPALLALIDVDDFKQVNDVHGHAAGDTVLSALARLLRQQVDRGDLVARLGGDEFVVLRDGDDLPAFRRVMQALCAASFAQIVALERSQVRVTLSVGVTRVDESLSGALEQADRAMYQAKRRGKNDVQVLLEAEAG